MPIVNRDITTNSITLRRVSVSRVEDITPALRRIVFTGDELGAFTRDGMELPAFTSTGFDDSIKLFFPYPGEDEPVLPVQKHGTIEIPKDPRPIGKDYTVRAFDESTTGRPELTVDFVKHGVGVATNWAYRCTPGDTMHFAGPPTSSALPDADWLLVVGEDTAIPAIARLLENLPEDARAQVFIEIAVASHRAPLRQLPGVHVTWLPRGGQPAGTTTLLTDAVEDMDWWEGRAFAWIGGESGPVKHIRRHLIAERGMDKKNIDFTGYWRRGEVVTLDDDPAIPDPEANPEAWETFHELAEIGPAYALRTAADLDLGNLIFHGTTSVGALAETTGANPRALGKLLRYLVALEILLETSPGHFALSETGEFLTVDDVLAVLHHDGAHARLELGWRGLTETVMTGEAVYRSVTGQTYGDLRSEQWYEDKLQDGMEEIARYQAGPLAGTEAVKDLGHVVLHGNGAANLAAGLVAEHPDMRVSVVAMPSQADFLGRALAEMGGVTAEQRERISVVAGSLFGELPGNAEGDRPDAVLLIHLLGTLPDADASLLLAHLAGRTEKILAVEDTFDVTGSIDEHAAENDVLSPTVWGSGYRTGEELATVFADAGVTVAGSEKFGWDRTIYMLTAAGR